MTTPTAEFALDLNDGMSGPAADAAGALEKLRGKLDQDTKSLRAMEAAMKRLTSGTVSNVEAVRALQSKMNATKDSIAANQAKFLQLGGTFDATAKKTRVVGSSFDKLTSSAQAMPGPLGGIVSRFSALRGMFAGGALVGGLLAFAAAAAAALVGIVALTVAITRYAIAHGDARRQEQLHLEGMIELRRHMGQTIDTASGLQTMFDRVARGSALGRDRIAGMGEEFYRARLRGDQLSGALRAYSTIEAAVGEDGARRWRGRIIAMARAGRAAEANAMADQRFGRLARRQMLGLDAQGAKLRESFGALFDGIRIEGFLEALHTITDLFSQNTETGRALKTIVEGLVQPIIDQVTAGAPLIRRFFQGMVIGALVVSIGILALRNKLHEAFGDKTVGHIDGMRVALWAGVAVVGAFVLAAAAAVAVIAVFAAGLSSLATVVLAVPTTIGAVIYGLYRLVRWVGDQDWPGIGRSIVDGIVNGIAGSAGRLTQQLRILAAGARDTIEGALGIHSPSRVFAELGVQIPRGFAQGVERGAPRVSQAVGDMAEGSAQAVAPGARSSSSISIGDVHVMVQGGADVGGDELEVRIRRAIVEAFEGLAIHAGAEVPT